MRTGGQCSRGYCAEWERARKLRLRWRFLRLVSGREFVRWRYRGILPAQRERGKGGEENGGLLEFGGEEEEWCLPLLGPSEVWCQVGISDSETFPEFVALRLITEPALCIYVPYFRNQGYGSVLIP